MFICLKLLDTEIFWDVVYLLGHFPWYTTSPRQTIYRRLKKKKNQISSDVILVFPLNLWEWWHVWSGCHFTRKSSGCCVSLLLFPLFGGCNLLGCAVSLHVGCASLAAYCSPHPNWSLITEPSVHKLWVPLLVCCFPEWEAWSLDLPCLLAILDCAFPIFKNFFCLVCLWEI